jgi:hypothetical protein
MLRISLFDGCIGIIGAAAIYLTLSLSCLAE